MLVLLALAGGFVFAVLCVYTRFPSQRASGQLYFYAAVCAILLILLARLVLVIGAGVLALIGLTCWDAHGFVERAWEIGAGGLGASPAPTFFLAFVLAPIAATIVNWRANYVDVVANARERYATRLELFMDRMSVETKLIYIALKNGKVYVGYVVDQPLPKPHGEEESKYLTLWPQKSGYMDDSQIPQWTTDYSSIYEQIFADRSRSDEEVVDFEIIIPMDEILVARAYDQDLQREEFESREPKS
jgi:hypothetical protein